MNPAFFLTPSQDRPIVFKIHSMILSAKFDRVTKFGTVPSTISLVLIARNLGVPGVVTTKNDVAGIIFATFDLTSSRCREGKKHAVYSPSFVIAASYRSIELFFKLLKHPFYQNGLYFL